MRDLQRLKNLTILYAEDDDQLREITQKTLEMLAGKVYVARSGEEAMELYENNRIDIILLDIHMGAVSGITCAQKIRKINPKIPIVILSGSLETDDLLAACRLNLIDYLHKPIELNALFDVLFSSLEQLEANGMLQAYLNATTVYDFYSKQLLQNGTPVSLTKNEITALEFLISRRGQVVTYDMFSYIFDEVMSDGALKNLILRLRKKMGEEDNIRNLAKIGYTLI